MTESSSFRKRENVHGQKYYAQINHRGEFQTSHGFSVAVYRERGVVRLYYSDGGVGDEAYLTFDDLREMLDG